MDPNLDFDIYDDREHAYNVQNMHVGSDKKRKRMEYIYDQTGIHETKIWTPEAVYKIFDEAIANAGDNKSRSAQYGIKFDQVVVTVDKEKVTIRNGGVPMPIAKNDKTDLYIPEMMCSQFRTSSNYGKKRTGAGRNGFGTKEINTFSKLFIVRVGDAERKLEYVQTWKDNMTKRSEPQIKSYKGKNYVEISYVLDFERFGISEYSESDILHFKARAADWSFYIQSPVIFNDEKIFFDNLEDYGRLYFAPVYEEEEQKVTDHILSFENNNTRVIVADTPDEGKIISIVNGINTTDGGAHVDQITKKICEKFLEEAKKEYIKKFKEANKRSVGSMFSLKKILPHLSFIIVCQLEDPDWGGGQTKTSLRTFEVKVKVPKKIITQMESWSFVAHLSEMVDQKMNALLSVTDGKKVGKLDIEADIEDAGYAGHKDKWKDCIFIITEGKSAKQYPLEMLKHIPGGRRIIGIMPVKGKVLNLGKAGVNQIMKNKEYRLLKKYLGLQENMDYTSDENFSTLRYGKVMVLADADADGDHIRALIFNNFYCRWPSLLQRGYLFIKRTPLLMATRGKETLSFYFPQDYEEFLKRSDADKWKIRYYKGLATNNVKDIERDMQDPKYAIVYIDKKGEEMIQMAFDTNLADRRKEWLENWTPKFPVKDQKIPLSKFIDRELITFAFADLIRCIPGMYDGLKPGQRKTVWGIIKELGYSSNTEYSVENLGNIVGAKTYYHYGPKSLQDTITRMTQRFTGANNLPLITDDGLSGSRDAGGKDAGAPRYVNTKPKSYFQYIFRKEDEPILEILEDDGKKIEPRFMLPVIPLLACNGAIGIGFAWSCFFPNHNPLDIIHWIKSKLRGKRLFIIKPWYRGFSGEIIVTDRKGGKEEEEIEEEREGDAVEEIPEGDEVLISPDTTRIMITKGKYEKVNKGVKVTELPIGKWTKTYRKFLEKLKKSKAIKKFDDDCNGGDTIDFTLKGVGEIDEAKLGLVKSYSLNNMVGLDPNYKPFKFKSVNHMLETFYNFRLPYYQKRKDYILGQMKAEIDVCTEKMKLLRLIDKGKIEIIKRTDEQIIADLEKAGINSDLIMGGRGIAVRELTITNIDRFKKKLQKLEEEYKELDATSAEDLWYADLEVLEGHIKKELE